jgi:GNAT superfamily N-acetyltransferase
MTPAEHAVRRAGLADADTLTHILATGFHDDPPLVWILPDPMDRAALSGAFFRPFVELALADGRADIAIDGSGCALWLDVDVTAKVEDDPSGFRQQFIDAIGPQSAARFFILDDLFSAGHPAHESHAYLLFVGVTPHRQRQGVGTALLTARLAELDQVGQPAYLEASSTYNASLYGRLGFSSHGDPVNLPDGPSLYPMWRTPRAV